MLKLGKEQKETVDVKEGTVIEEITSEELIQRTEAAAKRLETANAQYEKNKLLEAARKAEEQLGSKSDAGQEPVELTKEEKKKKDFESIGWPKEFLPKNLR